MLNKVVERIAGDRRGYLALRAGGELRRIAIRSIVYIESQNQYQQLNLANSEGLLVQGVAQGWWSLNLVAILCFTYTGIFVLRVFDEPYGSGDVITFLLFLMIIIAVYVVFFKTIQYIYSAAEQEKAELQSKFLLEQMKAMQEALEE